jgi:hypothetical protein
LSLIGSSTNRNYTLVGRFIVYLSMCCCVFLNSETLVTKEKRFMINPVY